MNGADNFCFFFFILPDKLSVVSVWAVVLLLLSCTTTGSVGSGARVATLSFALRDLRFVATSSLVGGSALRQSSIQGLLLLLLFDVVALSCSSP